MADNLFRRGTVDLNDRQDARGSFSGGAIILCALASLCIIVLSLLAISRSTASMAMAQAAARETTGYYDACLEANRDIALARAAGSDMLLVQAYRISDVQVLQIQVDIRDGCYEILEWRSVVDTDWLPDQGLDVAK